MIILIYSNNDCIENMEKSGFRMIKMLDFEKGGW